MLGSKLCAAQNRLKSSLPNWLPCLIGMNNDPAYGLAPPDGHQQCVQGQFAAEGAAEVLQAVVHQRYKLGRSVVITANRVVLAWSKYLGDATMATTILDRLMHRCQMLEFEGRSYRLKEAANRIAISPESS